MNLGLIDTPCGVMVAKFDDQCLFELIFANELVLHRSNNSNIYLLVQSEIKAYFEGTLKVFKTPLLIKGTRFQRDVFKAISSIPYGETKTYQDIAKDIERPLAARAVGGAARSNPFHIIIPCHRIMHANPKQIEYKGGASRKRFLIQHEKNLIS